MGPADRRLLALRRAPVVDDRDAGPARGRRELRNVAEKGVEPGEDVEAAADRLEDRLVPALGQPATRRCDSDEQRGRRPSPRVTETDRLGECCDDRDVETDLVAELL